MQNIFEKGDKLLAEHLRQHDEKKADEAWEVANFASAEDDNDIWKELFGPRFKVEDAA